MVRIYVYIFIYTNIWLIYVGKYTSIRYGYSDFEGFHRDFPCYLTKVLNKFVTG